MLIILVRVLIVYAIVLFFLRFMGKRQVGEMQPFELVITLVMADIATLPMTQTSMPLLFSVVPLSMLVIVHFISSVLARKSLVFRKILNGKPVVVVCPKGVEFDALKEMNMTFDDLLQGLRSMNCSRLEDVAYVIVETNGTFSVILKSAFSPVVNKDLNIELPPASLPLVLISGGKIMKKNLQVAGVDESFLSDTIKHTKAKSFKDIVIFTLDANGSVFVQAKNEASKNIQTNFCGEGKW